MIIILLKIFGMLKLHRWTALWQANSFISSELKIFLLISAQKVVSSFGLNETITGKLSLWRYYMTAPREIIVLRRHILWQTTRIYSAKIMRWPTQISDFYMIHKQWGVRVPSRKSFKRIQWLKEKLENKKWKLMEI